MTTTTAPISETQAFLEALDSRPPNALTACRGWTVHDLTAHITAGADEIARIFEAYRDGDPSPATRSFDEREPPYRAMDDAALRKRLFTASVRMTRAMDDVLTREPDVTIPFTGRPFKAATFAMHGRSELAIHRWDMVGDDEVSWRLLGQPELTAHAVHAMGAMLFQRGCVAAPPPFFLSARLRAGGQDDVVVESAHGVASVRVAPAEGDAAIESDPAARLLFIWGRRPNDPSRLRSLLAAAAHQRLEGMLAGF
jgi:uncharacterized protein (TIGR03083 family)